MLVNEHSISEVQCLTAVYCRKVAAVSGDARRALDICRRATELAEGDTEDSNGIVTMQHVDQALGEMIASTKVQAIR
jgi:origin recognition complex subunit 1